jgi:CHAT domain-containing protein/tetratricopeptide (TPR) repeat protein
MRSELDLRETFERFWHEIRAANIAAGQARNEASSQTVSLARQALQLATESGSERFLAEACWMGAITLNANEQYPEAADYYDQAIEKFDRLGEHALAARLRIGNVMVLAHAGRYREALEAAALAEKWFEKNPDEEGRARLLVNTGVAYNRLNNYSMAVQSYSEARRIFQTLNHKEGIARTSLNLANVLSNIDQFEQADRYYEECRELSEELELHELAGQAGYNRANLQYLRGRYSDALNSFGRLRQLFELSGSRRHRALCDLDEAEIYFQLGLSNDAAVLAQRAMDEFRQIGMPLEEARALTYYGVALMQMRRFAEALEVLGAAQGMFEEGHNSYWIGLLELYRAEVHLSLQRLWEAQALATEARAIFRQLEIPSKQLFSLVVLGRVALTLNDLAAAEEATKEISLLIDAAKVPLVLFPYHVLCGEIAERSRKWDEAQRHYQLAVEELERHQARLHHDDLRVTFFKGRQQAYDALVRLSLEHPDSSNALETAYAWCERARSRGLIELLSHYAPSIHGQAEQSLLAKISRLREELNIQYARSQPETRPLIAQANYETIALKEQELARTLREVSGVDPEYASLQQVSIATIESLRRTLPQNTTLVEYFTTGEEILAFVVSRSGANVVRRICPTSRILSLQERLRFQIEKFLLGRDYINAHAEQILESTRRRLHELYKYLIAPFVDEIRTSHIAIVPHGTLHFLPFHAFFDGERYLIDRFEISYAPSASVLKYCLEKPDVSGTSPVLIGVADEKAPLVDVELAEISRLFPNANLLQGAGATREAFVASTAAASSFIHIATHAIFRQDNPMFSSFKLSDGYFTAFDLFSLVCPTNLVTLSGCQSGMSEVTGSDDLLGLMRGFLYAGARSLLVSLWNVNDESTAALMLDFYREWQKGSSKSTAFRHAMLSIRETHPNPFYWAPFLLVGNP